MKIRIMESTTVHPAQATPNKTLWCSNLDVVASRMHLSTVYFYKSNNGGSDFFDTGVLKESLSRVLVPFYPVAGRLGWDEDGRIEVKCNGEGVLFIEAETSCEIDDFVDFNAPTSQLKLLVPSVDYSSMDISSYPLLLLQVTFFKCGGVCLGVGFHRTLVDGTAALHFINTWSDMNRGLAVTAPPVFDHDLLRARVPPTPSFHHNEFKHSPSIYTPKQTKQLHSTPLSTSIAILKITPDQLKTLKANAGSNNYSSYEVLAAHIWRCACQARGLPDDEVTSVFIPVDGRSRLNPPLPRGYSGNAICKARLSVLAREIQSGPLIETVKRIRQTIKRMDDDYLRSVIDYLEVQKDLNVVRVTHGSNFKYPNLHVVSWARLPIYDADFGWGRPVFMGPASIYFEGAAFILPSPINGGSLSLIIGLESEHIKLFEDYFYDYNPMEFPVQNGRQAVQFVEVKY
ncbi:shikimate O-hydroxycinnamoyltransferase-like [Tripterygium wilfordii]|uniref:Shikimate O-hydroxycinnamoyltransferase-like n=1 Tax=Tripterygium wilfordii TaxID=458696 RepID=A0A7J7DT84_TRIWF|nr:shikimate O-hydroxycinnamoyltransferase-like [Tripterygium wilfordii]KAF5749499.1 shikimate O-hydroxycinnamoyltransferase-like [Tripterygium wilfordii]